MIDVIFGWLFAFAVIMGFLVCAVYFNHIESLKIIAAKDPIVARCASSTSDGFIICAQFILNKGK